MHSRILDLQDAVVKSTCLVSLTTYFLLSTQLYNIISCIITFGARKKTTLPPRAPSMLLHDDQIQFIPIRCMMHWDRYVTTASASGGK